MPDPRLQPDPLANVLPEAAAPYPRGLYDPLPAFAIAEGTITRGAEALAGRLAAALPRGLRVLAFDGFHGVDFAALRAALDAALDAHGITPAWLDVADCLAAPEEIRARLEPFLGGDDPLFGRHFPLGPDVFFDARKLADYRVRAAVARGRAAGALTIVYGCGAGLVDLWDALWYADLPKDVVQRRARSGQVTSLGEPAPVPFGDFYKRAYFTEWPALARHKQRLLPAVDVFIDAQDPAGPAALDGAAFRAALREVAAAPFRPRPWFWPGPWGGKYLQGHVGLDPEQPNFAWSFELITPENGLVLEKDGERLECSFDCLLFQENTRVMGREAARQFRYEWPLRLDYLDTIDGGNLSVQCHPRPDYVRERFGETFTQDETYYITAAQPGARVFLGFQDGTDPDAFRRDLEQSVAEGREVAYERYVQGFPSRPHDLFLIPNGTIHCSGRGNLVLEISATPYIFTFKIYDYLRRDLEGRMRPLNLDRAWDNLRFERRGDWVRDHLVPQPRLLRSGDGWQEYVLMERPEFFYNIHRVEFEGTVPYDTEERALAVNLVEGEAVDVVTAGGRRTPLRFLESMVVPAAVGPFTVENRGSRPCKLVVVYVRPGTGTSLPLNDPIA